MIPTELLVSKFSFFYLIQLLKVPTHFTEISSLKNSVWTLYPYCRFDMYRNLAASVICTVHGPVFTRIVCAESVQNSFGPSVAQNEIWLEFY